MKKGLLIVLLCFLNLVVLEAQTAEHYSCKAILDMVMLMTEGEYLSDLVWDGNTASYVFPNNVDGLIRSSVTALRMNNGSVIASYNMTGNVQHITFSYIVFNETLTFYNGARVISTSDTFTRWQLDNYLITIGTLLEGNVLEVMGGAYLSITVIKLK